MSALSISCSKLRFGGVVTRTLALDTHSKALSWQ
jgi:hypothetical protein